MPGTDVRQMWSCRVCRGERQWGNGYPASYRSDEHIPSALLVCDTCGGPTEHYFSRIKAAKHGRGRLALSMEER